MKSLAIMQPYFFPYLGYFQLIDHVDEFVVYDDVQFIRRGWIHRNRILVRDKPVYILLPLKKDSRFLPIRERRFAEPFAEYKQRILRQLRDAYSKAPFFEPTYRLVEETLACDDRHVAAFVEQTLIAVCAHLGITTRFTRASTVDPASGATGEERIIRIAGLQGAGAYVNAAGGRHLYDPAAFSREGIDLQFLDMDHVCYDQIQDGFTPNLSIVDVLMFNSPDEVRGLLRRYSLERSAGE